MKYFSMFSGIGGFEKGIQQAYGILNNEHALIGQKPEQEERSQGRKRATNQQGVLLHDRNRTTPLCIAYSEIDKYAIKVYERHFNGHKNYGNATDINAKELPNFDLLVGGFPCQAFSIAGKRAGFNDTRGTLFFDIARILKEKRPRHLVLENVKGLLSHEQGKTFQTILGILADLGYRVEWQVLNSKDFGVPQNRERVYIIGHFGNECREQVFPIRNSHQSAAERVQGHHANTLTARYEGAQATGSYIIEGELHAQKIKQLNNPKHSNDRVYSEEGIGPTLNTMQGGRRQPFVAQEPRIRRLTPKECERLQGFPDSWTSLDQEGNPISDTQRYKMCGNAVTVNVVEAVIRNLYELE